MLRLGRARRRDLRDHFARTVADFERELPLPTADRGAPFRRLLCDTAAYIALPYEAVEVGPAREFPERQIAGTPVDPVDFLLGRIARGGSAIVVGDPGSGKTLVAALTFATLADEYVRTRGRTVLPVFIRLNSLDGTDRHEPGEPLDRILALLPEPLRSLGAGRVRLLLDHGRIAFVLDGLDELPSTLGSSRVSRRMLAGLDQLLAQPSLVTCREAFHDLYVDTDGGFRGIGVEVRLLPFGYHQQVIPFVQKYCETSLRPQLCATTLDVLRSNERLSETLSRPLMLRMTIDVLVYELDQDENFASRVLLTGSDHTSAEIYERYILSWIRREHRKADRPVLRPLEKVSLVESIAWKIFGNPVKRDAGYGSFELTDLLIDREDLVAVAGQWMDRQPPGLAAGWTLGAIVTELENRTFLIMSERADTYRFAHKSFFEYLLARHVHNGLSRGGSTEAGVLELLGPPLPDEVIDFLRELLHWSRVRTDEANGRENAEAALLGVLRDGEHSDRTMMARQQAANLLPIVATARTRHYLRTEIAPTQHPFIRRAIAVGEALHHADASLLNDFVTEMQVDPTARSFHMGYNRIYYGDQPLSSTDFTDDGAADCSRFFRACVRHVELDSYRHLRTMALATVRLMLLEPARRALLCEREEPALLRLRAACAVPDDALGAAYDRERRALAEQIDRVLDSRRPGFVKQQTSRDTGSQVQRLLPQGAEEEVDRLRPAGEEH